MGTQLKDPPVTTVEALQVCSMAVGFCTVADWWGNEDELLRFYGMVHLFNEIYHTLFIIEALRDSSETRNGRNILARIGQN